MNRSTWMRRALPLAAALAAPAAMAHTGHGTESLFEGLVHPLGLDHLLAMVAVGLWSAAALPGARRFEGPAVFLAALVGGAAAGVAIGALPLVEPAIAASVVVLAVMMAAARRLSPGAGLALVGSAGALHGLAHGAELPHGGPFVTYALGFIATTALLHAAGLGLGRTLLTLRQGVWRGLSAAVGLSGLLLLFVRT